MLVFSLESKSALVRRGQSGASEPPSRILPQRHFCGERSTIRPRCRTRLLLEGARLRGRSSRIISWKDKHHIRGSWIRQRAHLQATLL